MASKGRRHTTDAAADSGGAVAASATCIPIDVAQSAGRGLGAFAASAISAGALVCSYDGERITQREVQERYDSTAGGDYLFEVRKPSADRDGLYLDAERGAHASRFYKSRASTGTSCRRQPPPRKTAVPKASTSTRSATSTLARS